MPDVIQMGAGEQREFEGEEGARSSSKGAGTDAGGSRELSVDVHDGIGMDR